MKKISGWLAIVCAAGITAQAQNPAEPTTLLSVAPTGTVSDVAESPPPSEWIGYVRVLRGEQGEARAVRLVADDKLFAVELDEKGTAMAATPKTRKLLVKGELVTRDNRPWLVVSDFQDAPDKPADVAVPAPPPVATNTPPAAANTNEAVVAPAP